MNTRIRTYSELIKLPTFAERLEYLKLTGKVGEDTFGYDRYLNQNFYTNPVWKRVRRDVIVRDLACDLAIPGMELDKYIVVHHMNPITKEDILMHSERIIDPEYLICTSPETHKAIHYGFLPQQEPVIRTKNDTCPWRK